MTSHSLPKLPPSVEAIVATAATQIAVALREAGLEVSEASGAPSGHLYTVLYLLKQYALEQTPGQPGLPASDAIPLGEIAAVMETLAQIGRMWRCGRRWRRYWQPDQMMSDDHPPGRRMVVKLSFDFNNSIASF